MTGCISMSTNELERYQLCIKLEQRLITQFQVAEILSLTRVFNSLRKSIHISAVPAKQFFRVN